MNKLLSKKGFVFTLSAIIFATTLIFYSQLYLSTSYDNEKSIIKTSSLNVLSNINDGVSFNLMKVIGVNLDVNCSTDLNIYFYEKLSKGYNVSDEINNFESILNNEYFGRKAGTQILDVSELKDGVAEIFVGDKVTIASDYSNNGSRIYPLSVNQIVSMDINIYASAPADSNSFTFNSGGIASDKKLVIKYVDTNALNQPFEYSTNEFNPALESKFVANFPDDKNIEVLLGLTENGENSFSIVSGISSDVYYSVKITYDDCSDYLPVRLNATLIQSLGKSNSNTMLKIIN